MSDDTDPIRYQPPTAAELLAGIVIFGGLLLWNWW